MTLKYADQVKKGFMIDSKNARIKRRSYPVNPTVITLLPFREKFGTKIRYWLFKHQWSYMHFWKRSCIGNETEMYEKRNK